MAVPAIEKVNPAVHLIRLNAEKTGWTQWFLLRSDAHNDNTHCDQALQRRHLTQAKERDAGILDFGDFHCAMQGKWDRRADQTQLRDELRGNNYLDRLVDYNAGYLQPFAGNVLFMSPGNHETAIQKHHQTNLTERTVERLRAAGSKASVGTYAGYIGFRFTIGAAKRKTLWLAYHHGFGGGGPVTRGVIGTNRMAVYLPDATFVVTGHTHDEWVVPIARSRVNDAGRTFLDEQVHIKCAGYKDEYSCHEGYHIEGGRPPKLTGATWLRFYLEPGDTTNGNVRYEVTRAK